MVVCEDNDSLHYPILKSWKCPDQYKLFSDMWRKSLMLLIVRQYELLKFEPDMILGFVIAGSFDISWFSVLHIS